MKPPKNRIIQCPKCQKDCIYDEKNPYRPFCSARCKNVDTIAWADGTYNIEGRQADPEEILEEIQKNN